MQYKSILLDVDGTIVPVGPHLIPSAKVTAALLQAKQKLHVSVVTGRPLDWLTGLFDHLQLQSLCVINGGTQIIDPRTKEIVWEMRLDKQSVKKILIIAKKDNISFLVNDGGTEHRDPIQLEFEKPLVIQISYLDPKKADKYLAAFRSIPNVEAHSAFSWKKNKIDIHITHPKATKYHAVKKLASLLNIKTSEMIGVGDSMNDVPLLKACGLKVAMGNATPTLKDLADYVAPGIADDGVADVVEKFILTDR